MAHQFFDQRKMNRFRLVGSKLTGTSGDSWGIELVLRALAGSRAAVLPTMDGMSIDHGQYLAYWHGLHFLAVARLGWRDPGRGFRAWYDLGRPKIDETLEFISSVWGADDTLDAYVAWATRNHKHLSHVGVGGVVEAPSEVWLRWARTVSDKRHLELLTSDANPPHLGLASDETETIRDEGFESLLTIADRRARRGVFVTGNKGFYQDLASRWQELPDVAPDNWRVDVFNRRLGFIGTYRMSRVTGLLHVGKHSVHMLGNSPTLSKLW